MARKAAIRAAVRREVALRNGGRPGTRMPAKCRYCGAAGAIYWPSRSDGRPSGWVHFSGLELDHALPEAEGGEGVPSNIVLACQSCNRRKHTKRWVLP